MFLGPFNIYFLRRINSKGKIQGTFKILILNSKNVKKETHVLRNP